MWVGGINAENSQVSDGRRAPLNKCRDCDNVVRARNAHLCTECNLRAFEGRQKVMRARALLQHKQKYQPKKLTPVQELSRGLIGLQHFWLSAVAHRSAG